MVKKSKRKTRKLTKDQIAEIKKRDTFQKQIEEIFVYSGFKSLKVNGKQFCLGNRQNEIDHCFVYENLLIICEDTLKSIKEEEKNNSMNQPYNKNHKLEKEESSCIIKNEKQGFVNFLSRNNMNCEELQRYKPMEFKIFYLYFEYGKRHISDEDIARYKNLIFIDSSTMNYFVAMSKSIKASFKYEIFRFLKLSKNDIGKADPYGNRNIQPIISSIIYPDSVTGFSNGVRMVSFMMKPIDLIENSCVLRKDSWNQKMDLYQRLISPKRIKSIREYVCKNKTTFLNNIIVTLPPGIKFFKKNFDNNNEEINIDDIIQYDKNIEIQIPVDYNCMAIIDGQHRVYAYYEDYDKNNELEKKIEQMRKDINLLVTGIIYPINEYYNDELEKRKFESNLFVSINKNAKPVDADTLIQVQSIMNPTSGEAISRKVIEILNKEEPFKNMFQLSKVEDAPIKTASIIQYALSSLLVAKNNMNSLYYYWLIKKSRDAEFKLRTTEDINDYINYCSRNLVNYFKAIKSKFLIFWNKDSKLLKVISLNAFIIAYRETLKDTGGPQDYSFYQSKFKNLKIDFSDSDDNPFKYAGAQYSKFAKAELIPLFINNN